MGINRNTLRKRLDTLAIEPDSELLADPDDRRVARDRRR